MRRIIGASAVVLLGACSSGSTDKGAEYEVAFDDPGQSATVVVSSTDEAEVRPAIEHVVNLIDDSKDEGGWFIYATCDEGVTGKVENAVGQARFAKGNVGEAQTGVPEGEFDFRFFDGATCPGTSELTEPPE